MASRLSRWGLLAIFVGALAVRSVAIVLLGIRMGGDSQSYISRAEAVVNGGVVALFGLPLQHAPLYSLFLAPGVALGVDVRWYAVVAQAILGAATAFVVALLAARGTGSAFVGYLSGSVAAVHLTFPFWGTYVLSDTLFLFVLSVTAERLLALGASRRVLVDSLVAGALLILTALSRPNAAPFVLLAPAVGVLAAHGSGRRLGRIVVGMAAPALVLIAAYGVLTALGKAPAPMAIGGQVTDWARSAVYVGLVWTEQGRATAGVDVGVNPPPVLALMNAAQREAFLGTPVDQDPFGFIARRPEFFLEQAVRKLKLLFAPVLPEYSFGHALVSGAYFLALYVLGALGVATAARRHLPFVFLCALGIVAFTLPCVLTFVDYDQRYRLPIELFLIPLAGAGCVWLRALLPARGQSTARTRTPRPLASVTGRTTEATGSTTPLSR